MSNIGSINLNSIFYKKHNGSGQKSASSDDVFANQADALLTALEGSVGNSASANSAQSPSSALATGVSMASATTASTLWQAQTIGQSPSSNVIDVEEESSQSLGKSVTQKFLEQMNKSPEELMRDSVLKELGLSEDDLKSMDPKTLAVTEAKIKELIEAKIKESMREKGISIDTVQAVNAQGNLAAVA